MLGSKRARSPEREIAVTPLAGPGLCTLLEVAGYRLLLDAGWGESLDGGAAVASRLASLGDAPLDAVLLSHGGLAHAGGLPFLLGARGGAATPVYATAPVHRMGQLALYDALLCRSVSSAFLSVGFERCYAAPPFLTCSLIPPPPPSIHQISPPTPTTRTYRWTPSTTPSACRLLAGSL